jgi:N-acetylmuramoyl-L-alanine amidase
MATVKFKVRNKLHMVDNIGGAQVQFLDSAHTAVLSGTTNGHGIVSLNLHSLANGTYSCDIEAPSTYAGDVGPALATGAVVADRIYRSVTLTIRVSGHAIQSASADNPQYAKIALSGNLIVVDIQPVWMKSPANELRNGQTISMIIVHHTACGLGPAVATFVSEKSPHYMIDTDGQIVKWVQDSRAAWHAGVSRWAGINGINPVSIGIEIVHETGPYPEAQYTALLSLLDRLTKAFSSIDSWNIIGHSDIGTSHDGRLGRKSGDPGLQFEWQRLEGNGLGLLPSVGSMDPSMYDAFFQSFPAGSLRLNDNDTDQRFNGAIHKEFHGSPVRELQQDLATIGYSTGTADGDFGEKAHHAVLAIQEHFFAGGRGPAPSGRVDLQTAALIKSVMASEALRECHMGDYPIVTANMA